MCEETSITGLENVKFSISIQKKLLELVTKKNHVKLIFN